MRELLFLFLVIVFSSCNKVEDVIVDGNIIPPDYTIENSTIDNYINKLYISTIGREPTETEFDNAFITLHESGLSQDSREIIIDEVLDKSEYYNNLFKLESANILTGIDTADINQNILVLNALLSNSQGLDSMYFYDYLQKMLKLQEVLPGLSSGAISNIEMHKRMINNNFYDEINMGTENFVISIFQNFLGRYPSFSETENASTMVDGGNASLFFISGTGKEEFINIFFGSDEYFTGQTNTLFNRYLFRNPNSEESVNYSLDYMETEDYKILQKRILSTNEFIGI